MTPTEKQIEAALAVHLSSVDLPAYECLNESDVREILSAALAVEAGTEPRAWFVKDYADGWIHFDNEVDAQAYRAMSGSALLVAYSPDALTTSPASSAVVADFVPGLPKLPPYSQSASPHGFHELWTEKQMKQYARETAAYWRNDVVEKAAQIVERYGADHWIASDIRALALQASSAVEGEAVAIYRGNGLIDCGNDGHHNIEILKLIPAGMPLYTHPAPTPAGEWRPIETAPHGVDVLLATPPFEYMGEQAKWELRVGAASWGERIGGISNISRDAHATHWQPLPASPAPQTEGSANG